MNNFNTVILRCWGYRTAELCNEASCTRKHFQMHLDLWVKEALGSNQQFTTKTKLKSFSPLAKSAKNSSATVVSLTLQSLTVLAQSQWHLFHPVFRWFCQNTVNNLFALWQGTRRNFFFFLEKRSSLTTEYPPANKHSNEDTIYM